jgi:uncharacterized protein (DUF924 family)
VARRLLQSGTAGGLSPVERMFLLMPLMHSEDVTVQRESVSAFEELASDAAGDQVLASALDYAKRHAVVVERFGRFPHRNVVLGRTSTPDELAFLARGSPF